MLNTKTEWRRTLLGARSALAAGLRRSHSATIAARVRALPAFAACRALAGYEPIGAEVDPREILGAAVAAGRPTYVPAGDDHEPRWRPWSASGDSATASRRVLRPEGSPLLLLVPGVGFDVAAMRLGRGVGFYDRALASLRDGGSIVAVGLAFEAQIVPALPTERWDQPVDLVVTEARVIVRAHHAHASLGADAEEVSES